MNPAIRFPLPVLLVFLALTACMAWFARGFEINASAETLLTEGNAKYVQARQTAEQFSPEEFLLIAYEPRDFPVLSERAFAQIGQLSAELRQLERVASVRSLLNVPLLVLADDALSSDFDPDSWTIEQRDIPPDVLKKVFDGHPLYEDLLINQAQTATAIQLLFKPNAELDRINRAITQLQLAGLNDALSEEQQQELDALKAQRAPLEAELRTQRSKEIEQIREIVGGYEDTANLYLGGGAAIGHELIKIVKNDLVVFGSAIAGLVALLLLILFRGVRWVVIPMLCCAASALITLGLFALLGFKATVISSNFIALQLILTLAIVVHLIVQYLQDANDDPEADQKTLIRRTLAEKAAPCFYAGLTTSVGFASLVLSGIKPVIDFGWMMIAATLISIVTSLILFPAVLALWPRHKAAQQDDQHPVLTRIAHATTRSGGLIVLVSLAILAAGVVGALRLSVDNSFINYFAEDTDVHRELTFVDQQLGGSTPMNIVYDVPANAQKTDVVLTAETVQTLQRAQAGIEDHEATGKVLSVVNMTEVARKLNNNKPLTEYEMSAMYWLIDEELRDELLSGYFDEDTQELRISVRVQDTTKGLDRGALIDALHADMQAAGIARDDYQFTGLFVLYQDLLERLFQSQILTLGAVFAGLLVAFLLIFRSLVVAVIAIMPNVITTAAVLGFMGWVGIPLDFMTITIAAIAMGIAVDDTIHYVHRYLAELKDQDPADAVTNTHVSVGKALGSSTLIIAVGFSLLMFSDFVPSVMFGLLTGLAVVLAYVTDMLLLPVLLQRLVKRRPRLAGD